MITSPDLFHLFHEGIALLKELRARAALPDLQFDDTPTLRADARRFAEKLRLAHDLNMAECVVLTDRAGAQAFWHLVETRWNDMETFLLPGTFTLGPDPLPFETLCRCEELLDDTVPPPDLTPIPALGETAERELESEQSTHTAAIPGVMRPVRSALIAPEVEAAALD
jgi:hypothetical protein